MNGIWYLNHSRRFKVVFISVLIVHNNGFPCDSCIPCMYLMYLKHLHPHPVTVSHPSPRLLVTLGSIRVGYRTEVDEG